MIILLNIKKNPTQMIHLQNIVVPTKSTGCTRIIFYCTDYLYRGMYIGIAGIGTYKCRRIVICVTVLGTATILSSSPELNRKISTTTAIRITAIK